MQFNSVSVTIAFSPEVFLAAQIPQRGLKQSQFSGSVCLLLNYSQIGRQCSWHRSQANGDLPCWKGNLTADCSLLPAQS